MNRIRHAIKAASTALAVGLASHAGAQTTTGAGTQAVLPDSDLFRSYETDGIGTVPVTVCGTIPGVSGCTSTNGGLGPYGRMGPMVEGNPVYNSAANTVTRKIYTVDLSVNGGTGVALMVYQLTETIVPNEPFEVSFKLVKKLPLQLTGGATAKGFMVANSGYVFIATDQSPYVIEVQKSGLVLKQLQVSYPTTGNISGITADSGGYVSLNEIDGTSTSGAVYAPDGSFFGGAVGETALNTTIGLIPEGSDGSAASKMHMRYLKPAPVGLTEH